MTRFFVLLAFGVTLALCSCFGGNFAPVVDKGGKYYGRSGGKSADIDSIIESLSE